MITVDASAERALQESEERWRTLLAHIREMVILVDADGLVTYTSPSVHRWLGYATEELVGHKIAAVTAISHVDDAVALGSALDRCEPAAPVSLTHRLRARDGSWRWLESTMVCLREDPLVGGVLITSRDVTDRLALEQERERLDLDRRVSQRLEASGTRWHSWSRPSTSW
jgi:PAS domain S-box-containing protein